MSAPATRAKPRPTSPHLQVYRLIPTMLTSILHRITGCALYFGTLLVAWWVIAAAAGEDHFNFVNAIYGSWFGILVLVGYTWAFILHLMGGLRHLVWDTGAMMDKATTTRMAKVSLVLSFVLTIAVWAVVFALKG